MHTLLLQITDFQWATVYCYYPNEMKYNQNTPTGRQRACNHSCTKASQLTANPTHKRSTVANIYMIIIIRCRTNMLSNFFECPKVYYNNFRWITMLSNCKKTGGCTTLLFLFCTLSLPSPSSALSPVKGKKIDTLCHTLLKLVTTARASPSSRYSSSPLNVLCRSAAARLCPCTSR